MSYSSDLTRQRILECAEQEFLEQGYPKANLRKIAEKAKATTGALYAHFKNKAELFDALVKGPADELYQAIVSFHQQSDSMLENTSEMTQSSRIAVNSTDWMLDYIYEHLGAFKLIICCSEGTPYVGYLDRLVEVEEQAVRKTLALANPSSPVDDFFIHVMCMTGYQEMFEVVAHDLPKEQALSYVEKTRQFRFAGWAAVLGLDLS